MRRIAYIAATAFAVTLLTGAAASPARASDVRGGISIDWLGGYGHSHYRPYHYYKPRPYYRPHRPYVVYNHHHYYRPHGKHHYKRKHWYKKRHHHGPRGHWRRGRDWD